MLRHFFNRFGNASIASTVVLSTCFVEMYRVRVFTPFEVTGPSASCHPMVCGGQCTKRFVGQLGLHVFGKLTPWKGHVSNDIECRDANEHTAGRTRRGLFARTALSFDRQIMNFPALTFYVGDEPMPKQCKEMLRWVLTKMSDELDKDEKPFTHYVHHRLMNLQSGSHIAFTSEDDVIRFLADVPKGLRLLKEEVMSTQDVNALATQLEMNRFHMEYEGRNGVALFPEASLFNHHCDPNVELTFSMNMNKEYVLEARMLKPVGKGDQLFVNYIPGNNLPLTRFAMAMRDRWGFECQCPICKSRTLSAMAFLSIFFFLPVSAPLYIYATNRQTSKAKQAGFL